MDRALQEDALHTPKPTPAPRRNEKPIEDCKHGVDVRGPCVLKRDCVGWSRFSYMKFRLTRRALNKLYTPPALRSPTSKWVIAQQHSDAAMAF